MDRRKFVGNAFSLSAVATLSPVFYSMIHHIPMNQSGNGQIVEWNAHLFSADTKKYPFHSKATYQPDSGRLSDDPLGVYLSDLDSRGIHKAVVVQPEPYGDDHSLVIDAVRESKNRLKGTSLFYPKDPGAPKKLEALVRQNPEIVATRFHAHRGKENYLDSFADPGVKALWKKAVDLDIIVELHIGPNYGKQVREALAEFPKTKVIIDHLAEPHMGTPVEYADILDLAEFQNVYMKFSGLGHFSDDSPDFLSVKSFTADVFNAFGAERMLMGGVSPSTVDAHMTEYSADDRAKVKGGNIIKLLNWM